MRSCGNGPDGNSGPSQSNGPVPAWRRDWQQQLALALSTTFWDLI
jgi:hypothetical protein